ncbi:uncharacterized protein WM294_002174 isoform 1-T1 [Sarcoramphus papa]
MTMTGSMAAPPPHGGRRRRGRGARAALRAGGVRGLGLHRPVRGGGGGAGGGRRGAARRPALGRGRAASGEAAGGAGAGGREAGEGGARGGGRRAAVRCGRRGLAGRRGEADPAGAQLRGPGECGDPGGAPPASAGRGSRQSPGRRLPLRRRSSAACGWAPCSPGQGELRRLPGNLPLGCGISGAVQMKRSFLKWSRKYSRVLSSPEAGPPGFLVA